MNFMQFALKNSDELEAGGRLLPALAGLLKL